MRPSFKPSAIHSSHSGRPGISGADITRGDRIAPARRRGPPDVPVEIELGVVDPDRIVKPKGNRGQPLAVARRAPQAAVDVLPKLLEARRRSPRRWLKHRRPANIHVGGRLSTSRNEASSEVNRLSDMLSFHSNPVAESM
jgi:hypothetical protein